MTMPAATPSSRATRWRWLAVGLAAAAIVAVAWLRPRAGQAPAAPAPARSEITTTRAPALPAATVDPAEDPLVAPEQAAPPLADPAVESVARARRSLEIYLATSVYPLWSRPLDATTRGIVDWNKPWPVGQPFAADADRREIRVDASLDKLFAAAGEAFTVTVTVAYNEAPRTQVAPDQIVGHVRYRDGDWKVAANVPFTQAGDHYVGRFTPSAIAALAATPREAQLVVHVQKGEAFPKDLVIPFQYAAEDPFTVLGIAHDRLTSDGSLEVALDVEVKHAAPTLVQAALFDAAGQRGIAIYSDYVRPTTTGRQEIAIRFYGKAIYDSQVSGRYLVAALNGHVKVPGATPPEVFWGRGDHGPPLMTSHVYAPTQFTRESWSSPEKDAKIKQYEDLIRELGEASRN